jgi:hypothetical protein
MKVTRDVVIDLLPLYAAGEASADTRILVEEFLKLDPELERRAREGQLEPVVGGQLVGATLSPDIELRSLRRTHTLLRWQRLTYAWALTLSCLSLSTAISFEGGGLHVRLLLLEYPSVFVPGIVLALTCWANYVLLRRRANVKRVA